MAEAARKMNIYEAISRCMEEIGAVGKDAVNKQQGFKYRGIDAVMNAINPALVKNHIFIVPEVLEQQRQERTTNKGAVLIYSMQRTARLLKQSQLARAWTVETKQPTRQWRSHLNTHAFRYFAFRPRR